MLWNRYRYCLTFLVGEFFWLLRLTPAKEAYCQRLALFVSSHDFTVALLAWLRKEPRISSMRPVMALLPSPDFIDAGAVTKKGFVLEQSCFDDNTIVVSDTLFVAHRHRVQGRRPRLSKARGLRDGWWGFRR